MKKATIKIEIEYDFPSRWSDKYIMKALENQELPKGYKEDSWEFIKIVKENE